jgi:ketosteroid isomerase-like protein
MEVGSREELADELGARDEVFGDVAVEFRSADVVGDRGDAEWVATAVHPSTLVIDDGVVIEATGAPLTVRGATVAELSGDRISELRQYCDEVDVLDGLGLLPDG